jgi:hypothetical protein
MQKLNELGYFSLEERGSVHGQTFAQVTASLIGCDPQDDLRSYLARHLNLSPSSGAMMTLEWLGLLNDDPVPSGATLLDVLADQMLAKMRYAPDERDMLVLVHEFVADYEDHTDAIASTLIDFGVLGGDTSMARTVGLPAAIGARLVLEGEIALTGVQIPVVSDVYEPVLAELQGYGITCRESTTRLVNR